MNASRRTIDARGLPCPQPVILAKKAVEEGGFDELEVIVDNESARENVLRYASFAGLEASSSESGTERRVIVRTPAGGAARDAAAAPSEDSASEPAKGPVHGARESGSGVREADASATTVFITADLIGRGDDELGRLLMRGFVFALTESAALPVRIILMNGGVALAAEGSACLESLRKLAADGVDVVSCGTCLEKYGLKEKLGVGRVSNMYEIAELLLAGKTLTL